MLSELFALATIDELSTRTIEHIDKFVFKATIIDLIEMMFHPGKTNFFLQPGHLA